MKAQNSERAPQPFAFFDSAHGGFWRASENARDLLDPARYPTITELYTRAQMDEVTAALRQRVEACEKQLGESQATIEALRRALERLKWVFGLVLAGKPCRDVTETLGGVDAALAHSTPALAAGAREVSP
jgi:hypothetical protein